MKHSFATGADGSGTRKINYTTPRIQNELLDVVAEHMQRRHTKKIQKVKFYSILADEGTDSSNKEQLALVLQSLFRS